MASYKQPCIHCGNFIESDLRFCPFCGSSGPFGYNCPNCMRSVEKAYRLCPACGQMLYVNCPSCSNEAFICEKCAVCGTNLSTT